MTLNSNMINLIAPAFQTIVAHNTKITSVKDVPAKDLHKIEQIHGKIPVCDFDTHPNSRRITSNNILISSKPHNTKTFITGAHKQLP